VILGIGQAAHSAPRRRLGRVTAKWIPSHLVYRPRNLTSVTTRRRTSVLQIRELRIHATISAGFRSEPGKVWLPMSPMLRLDASVCSSVPLTFQD